MLNSDPIEKANDLFKTKIFILLADRYAKDGLETCEALLNNPELAMTNPVFFDNAIKVMEHSVNSLRKIHEELNKIGSIEARLMQGQEKQIDELEALLEEFKQTVQKITGEGK